MSKPSVLLTGATGFLGSYLLDALIKSNYSTIILLRSNSNTNRIQHLEGKYKSYFVGDNTLERVFEDQQITCVIHTACNYGRGSSDISDVVDANLFFALDLLNYSLKYKVKTFINSDTFFNNGESFSKYLGEYVLSKKQFVEWIRFKSNTINVVNLKLHHVYGKNDNLSKFIPWFLTQLKRNIKVINLTDGLQKRDFIYIDDVVSAYLIVLKNIELISGYHEYEVGTGRSITLREFLLELKKIYTIHNPDSVSKLNFGAVKDIEGEIKNAIADNANLIKLGWTPCISINAGLNNLIS